MEADESLSSLNTSIVAQKVLNGELLLCDRPLRSKVWTVFSRITDRAGVEIKEFVYCRICGRVYSFYKLSTSNLVRHKCYIDKCVNTDKTSTKAEDEELEMDADVPLNNLTKLLTKWIIKDCQPYDLMQSEGLKAIFQELTRLGAEFGSAVEVDRLLPSCSAITENISVIYEQYYHRVKAEVISLKETGFGITANTWTNSSSSQNYIALTIHFLKAGIVTFRLLGLKALENNSYQNVAEKTQQILEEFDCKLSNKSIIVSERSCDITKALPEVSILPCISALLNEALQKSLEEVTEVKESIKTCVKLLNSVKQQGLNALFGGLSPISYPSSWLSTYKMLNSVQNNWFEIAKFLEHRQEGAILSTLNVQHLKAIIKTLEPFEEAIETLEEDSYATMHLTIVYLHELRKSCATNVGELNDFDFIKSLKETIRGYLDKIVAENITTLHKLALFLYPPTNKLLQFCDEEKRSTESACINLMICFKKEMATAIKQEAESPTTPASKRKKLFSDFVESASNHIPNDSMIQELQCYKSTRVLHSAEFDVFEWWESQKRNFPLLHKVSRVVLTTPASSAASKRVLRTTRSFLSEKYKQSSSDMEMEKIMFINSNAEHDEAGRHFLL